MRSRSKLREGIPKLLAVLAALIAVAVATPTASPQPALKPTPKPSQLSQVAGGWWLNARDGWMLDPSKRWRCTPKRLRGSARLSAICATSDGGKHWRLVFLAPTRTDSSDDVSGLVRTVFRWDRKNAVVSLWDAAVGWSQTWEFWTRDGGRHWWPTDVFHLGLSSVCYSPSEDPDAPPCADPIGFFSLANRFHFAVSTNYVVDTHYFMLNGWPRTSPMPPCPQRAEGSGPFVCAASLDAGFVAVPGL
jgi:hypothetical protein